MLRQFFNTSIEQSFLKALMSSVQFPKFQFVNKNDLIFQGYFYIYSYKVILCTKTGYVDPDELSIDDFVLGEDVGINYSPRAEYETIKHYNPFSEDQNVEFKEFIRASYYSTELHKRLGDYLRLMRDYYHIDLMGMYNCFSYEMINDLYIGESVEYVDGSPQLKLGIRYEHNSDKKILAIPVKFNRQYTIYITSSTPVYYCLMVKLPNGMKKLSSKYVSPELANEYIAEPHSLGITDFYNPPTTISTQLDIDQGSAYRFNDKLYLIVQVDIFNKSSLVVLEGDYRNSNSMRVVSSEDSTIRDTVPLIYKPQLIKFNDGNQYAYSNTIIPYLLRNVICNTDTTPGNISYAKQIIGMGNDVNYWGNDIKYLSYDKYLFDKHYFDKDDDGYNIQPDYINYKNNDVTGYIDSTIERWMNAKS